MMDNDIISFKKQPGSNLLVPVKNPEQNEVKNSLTGLVELAALGWAGQAQLSQTDSIHYNNKYYLISSDRNALSYLYVNNGLVQTYIDQPVLDGFRNGIKVVSDQLSADDIKDLLAFVEREDILNTVAQAHIWARLYGGAGLIVNAGQKADDDLNIKEINEKTPLEFYDADLWELSDWSTVTNNQLTKPTNDVPYNYYGARLHRSKVLRINGKKAPAFVRPKLRGWGMSEVERMIRSLNQNLKIQNLIFQLIDEAKIDVYRLKDYAISLATPAGTNAINQRVSMTNQLKNFQKALLLDINDEYEQKQLSFSGLAEIFKEIRIQVATDLKMPLTKLYGISAAGFNSGEDDLENYNSMVESEVRAKDKYIILNILGLCCMKLFGFIPDDMTIEYEPLRILSAEQEENIKTQQQNRILNGYDRQLLTPQEAIQAHNDQALIGNMTLDTEKDLEGQSFNVGGGME